LICSSAAVNSNAMAQKNFFNAKLRNLCAKSFLLFELKSVFFTSILKYQLICNLAQCNIEYMI
jgi:hypothetical protein